ncbi:MAG TPA: acyl-CoA dehydrogenase family protein [Mycobacteriales bacterium]|nr:acyl-CoA dehydrogenase family protein [Mycobacteriales bacterium]
MRVDYTDEQVLLREELQAYFTTVLTPEVRAELRAEGHGGPVHREVRQKLGTDGWLGIGWPKEYGGQGRSVLDQYVFFDEASRAGAPVPMIALNTVGPTIMAAGTEEQKQRYLPGILAGTLDFAIGYTEPGSGTDLASLRTRAVLDGDHWVVNGNKVYTSGGDLADFIWLAARTEPDAPKHKGISILLVPTAAEGFSATPIRTMGGGTTTATYYTDVHVPVGNVVGEVNAGWKLITTQLNHERVALSAMGGRCLGLSDAVRQWATETVTPEGTRVIDEPWVRTSLARVHARLEAMKVMNWRMAYAVHTGTLTPAAASAAKVYGTEVEIEAYRLLLDVLGRAGSLRRGSPGAVLEGKVEQAYRDAPVRTFGGGSNEVQREIICWTALGTPRGGR